MNGVIIAGNPAHPQARSGPAPALAALAPVANRLLLTRAIDTLRAAGADEITVVAGRDAAPSMRSGTAGDDGEVHWVRCTGTCDAGSALLLAADEVGGDRFLVHTTDGLWLRRPARALRVLARDDHDAVLLLRSVTESVAVAREGGEDRSVAILGEVPPANAEQLCGLHGFSRAIIDHLRETDEESEQRLYDAVHALAAAGGRVRATSGDGWWSYRGSPDELLEANRIALDGIVAADLPHDDRSDNRIEGRVVIDPTAQVSGSFIRGPAVIGAHATITDAYVGPYTSVGEAATIDNAEIESSIVLTGARIRHLRSRLDSSVIGPGASVGGTFEQPRAMRVILGEDARVMLA